jgi:hypothetical protein
MKKFVDSLLFVFVVSVSVTNIQAAMSSSSSSSQPVMNGLTQIEEQAILKTCLLPVNARAKLDDFFNDTSVFMLFRVIPRKLMLQPHWIPRMTQSARQALTSWQNETELSRLNTLRIVQKHINVQFLKGTNPRDTTYVIASEQLWPGHVLKIPTYSWPSYPQICSLIGSGSFEEIKNAMTPYQNVSRVFYAEKLRKFIKDEELKHIYVPKNYLYPYPSAKTIPSGIAIDGVIYPHINDTNYVVVSESVNINPSDVQFTMSTFRQMLDKNLAVKSEYEPLVLELVQVIEWGGLWELQGKIVLKKDSSGNLFACLFDIEKPGLGGSEDPTFFHKNSTEVMNNANNGFDQLVHDFFGLELQNH